MVLDFMMKQVWIPWAIVLMALLLIGASTGVLNTTAAIIGAAIGILTMTMIAFRSIYHRFSASPTEHNEMTRKLIEILQTTPSGDVIWWRNNPDDTCRVYSYHANDSLIRLWTTPVPTRPDDHTATHTLISDYLVFDPDNNLVISHIVTQAYTTNPDGSLKELADATIPTDDRMDHAEVSTWVPPITKLTALFNHLTNAEPETIDHS